MMSKVNIPVIKSYKPSGGTLGTLINGNMEWYTCRDRFQSASEHVTEFLFAHLSGEGQHVIEFIKTFQQAADIPKEHCCEVLETTEPNILLVRMTPWWQYRLRRSLLTALLRCGQSFKKHTGDAFEKALYSLLYTRDTRAAVERFMSGYTASKLKKRTAFYGWHRLFSDEHVPPDTVLVKLKRRRRESVTELTGELSSNHEQI